MCMEWIQFYKRGEKSRLSGKNRAACVRIVCVLGVILCRDTKCSIWSCQIITVRRIDEIVWKAVVNREGNHCVYN